MTDQPNRVQVKETARYWGDFEGTLTGIITSLQIAIDDGWEGIIREADPWSQDHEYPYLYKHRLENDKEYYIRMNLLKKEKEEKLKLKERRRKEYEKLKKEFEND